MYMLYVHVVCIYMIVHVVCRCCMYMHAHTGPHSSPRAVYVGAGHSPVHRVCQDAHENHREGKTCRKAKRRQDILPCEYITQYYTFIYAYTGLVAVYTKMYVLTEYVV